MAVSGKGSALSGLFLARRRRRRLGTVDLLVKSKPNDAAPVVFDDLIFSADPVGGGAYDLPVDVFAVTITAVDAQFSRGRSLPVDATSYTTSLQSISLAKNSLAQVTPTSFAITPSTASFQTDRQLSTSPTSFAVSFVNPTLVSDRQISVVLSSFTLTTSPVTFNTTRALWTAPDSLGITFIPAALDYVPKLNAELVVDPFSSVLTTSPVTLQSSRQLNLTTTTYSTTFANVGISATRTLPVSVGSYDILTQPSSLLCTRSLPITWPEQTYVDGYVESGYVGNKDSYSLKTTYVTDGYVQTGYVADGISGQMQAARNLAVNANSILLSFRPVNIALTGYAVWPLPENVTSGISYGPTGSEYVGTLEAVTKTIKLDISTGALVLPLNNKVVMTL
jgi:hypothetical protein